MNNQLLELALKKQRLQFRSDALRERLRTHANGLAPTLAVADRIHAGYGWLRRHPEVVAVAGVAVVAAKPRVVWRWLVRGVSAWQFWLRGRRWLTRLSATPPDRRT